MVVAVGFSCLGWSFDLFDLFILLYVAPVLAAVFFPPSRPLLALAGVYAAFAATLLMRPLGGVLFGPYADRHGRRRAMAVAALGVGLCTALMGALPSLAQAGAVAPIGFLLLRLAQGVFMGGMVASTHTIGTETIAPSRRGLASGIISGGGSGVGKLLASLVFLLATQLFPGPAFAEWGWRAMFFTGLISSVLGLLTFRGLEESPMWSQLTPESAQKAKTPLRELRRGGFLPVIGVGILLTLSGGGLSYLTSGYLPTFLRLVNHLPASTMGLLLSACAVAVIAASVFSGWLTDLLGRRRAILLYGVVSTLAIPTLYLQLAQSTTLASIAVLSIALSALGTLGYAPLLIILNERFPTALRSSGTSVAWNIGFSLGGSTPVLVSLVAGSNSGLGPTLAAGTAALGVVYLIAAWITPETRGGMR